MKLLNIYELEAMTKKEKKLAKLFKEYYSSHSLEESLSFLKLSGICINKYPNDKKNKVFNNVIADLKTFFTDDPKIDQFLQETYALGNLFNDLVNFREEIGLNSVPANKQILSFLMSVEILLGSKREYSLGKPLDQIMRVYPFVFAAIDSQNNLADPRQYMTGLEMISDSIAENAGYILRFLTKSGLPFERIKTTILNHEEVKLSNEHISLYDKWTVLERVEQNWRFFADEINQKNSNVLTLISNERVHKALAISTTRFRSQKNKWQFDFLTSNKKTLKSKINRETTLLLPEEFISEEESLYAICLGEFLSVSNLDIEINNVKLSEYLRAIMVVKLEMRVILEKRISGSKHAPYLLTNWCSLKKKNEWKELFAKHGITQSSAEAIVQFLIFDEDSRDLLDCPFIPYGDYVIVIPALASLIDPSMTIISNLSKKGADISFKGNGFEDELIEKLTEKGIKCSNLKVILNEEPFECDCAFVLGNDLFLLECKHMGQLSTPRDYYDFMLDLIGPDETFHSSSKRSHVEQLNRISNFYIGNLEYVRKKLILPQNWAPENIYKIILTNVMLGENLFIDNCYVVDSSTFQRFIDREPPGFSIGKVSVRPQHEDYEGEITTSKLLNIITNSPQIELCSKRISKEKKTVELFRTRLIYETFRNQIGDALHLDNRTKDAIIKKWNIPIELLSAELEEKEEEHI